MRLALDLRHELDLPSAVSGLAGAGARDDFVSSVGRIAQDPRNIVAKLSFT
jgi:hypothetical protein